ncbi:MAG TPA: hypothetical protein VH054_10295 [Polyangiaceae bacterium]|jgi:hypothetical protein|nr:hypothetical protein [Polyangiaceae bacterium]
MSAVRYVLARAAENGFFEAVNPATAPFDPLLRGGIRKAARNAFAEASASTSVTDEAHVLRLAYLKVAGRPLQNTNDVEASKAAFEQLKLQDPKRTGIAFWPASLITALVLLVVGVVGGFVLFFPSPRDRFAKSSLGEAMSDGLTDWVVGISRRDMSRQDKGRNVILSGGVKRQIGDSAFNLLGTALDQSKALSFATDGDDADREAKSLESTLRSLDTELQGKKIPAFFDNYVETFGARFGERSTVYLLGYYVEDRSTIIIGSSTFPVLRGRRLDNLNLDVGSKAYESTVLGGWVLAIDEMEAWTIAYVVPSLGKGRGFAFGAKAVTEGGSEGRLDAKAGEKIRGEILPLAKMEQDDATDLADALSQRHTAFIHLMTLGDELYEPRGLRASPRLKKALKNRQNLEMDAVEISRIEDRLARFEKPFDKVVAAQAELDEIRIASEQACKKDDKCQVTADDELAKAIGAKTLLGSKAAAVASRLMMIARGSTPYLALAESEIGTGGYVTMFVVQRELGLAPEWLGPWGPTDEAEHGQVGVATFDKPGDAIKKAAEAAYAKLFGVPMPALTRQPAPK